MMQAWEDITLYRLNECRRAADEGKRPYRVHGNKLPSVQADRAAMRYTYLLLVSWITRYC